MTSLLLANGSKPPHKTRLQGTLSQISDEHRAVLHRWFREALTYKEIISRCKAELGFKTSSASLSDYHTKHYAEIYGSASLPSVRLQNPIELELTLRIAISPELRVADAKAENVTIKQMRGTASAKCFKASSTIANAGGSTP